MNGSWYFPTTGGGDDDGINDAGLEQFEGDRGRYITRECIQNSLDARANDEKAVLVEFSRFDVPRLLVPGIDELINVFELAQNYSKNQERSSALYTSALECARCEQISVLKISDYNTAGLDGDDKNTRGNWYRLVRSNGTSSMSGEGGGSFGIGKSAPFATSALRTVFYSTKLADGSVAFQGKARLSSFEYNEDVKRGIGQYGILVGENKGVQALRAAEIIPDIFERSEQGTDIYVMGYKAEDDWAERITRAVLDNFWMAIREGTLEVSVKENGREVVAVDAGNLDELINQYMNDTETKLYYDAVKSPTQLFREDLPSLGEVELYVKVGTGAKRVLGMRRSLMKIHTLAKLRVLSDDYVGVAIVRGELGNKNLRMLEPPAHDKWDGARGNFENQQALKTLREYVQSCLKTIAGNRNANVEEIPDLGRYLPDDIVDDDRDMVPFVEGEATRGAMHAQETATEHGAAGDGADAEIEPYSKEHSAAIIRPGTAGGKHKRVGTRRRGKGSGGSGGAGEPDGNVKYADTSNMTVRTIERNQGGKRVYVLHIIPGVDDFGAVRIVAFGDGEDFPMEIVSAKDSNGRQCTIKGSIIDDLTFKAGRQVELEIELASTRRYILGVK